MVEPREYFDLRCRHCAWREVCGHEAILGWLRKAGKVRPGRAPEEEILRELFRATASQFNCPGCGKQGLVASPAAELGCDWPEPILCSSCSQPIGGQRLEAVPGTTLCAACQADEERGRGRAAPEYCPRCGAPMEPRPSKSSGITRYVLVCTGNPRCRR